MSDILNYTQESYLYFLCEKELIRRGLNNNEYRERLDYELSIISRMGFAGYFLVVADYVNWAKESNIPVGPGRGSGAGSLTAWLVNITDVDPIKYGLYFERFLNPDRLSMPDFDLDFSQRHRERVIQYILQKYGPEHSIQIGTIGTLKARSAFKDTARALGYEASIAAKYSSYIPEEKRGGQGDHAVTLSLCVSPTSEFLKEHQSEMNKFTALYDFDPDFKKIVDIAIELENIPKSFGTHAAGVIISPQPLYEYFPVQWIPKHERMISVWTDKQLEAIGLVKFDILGLRTLDVIQDACRYIKEQTGVTIDWDNISYDDPAVYEMLSAGDTYGVFQLTERGIGSFCKEFKPTCLEDLSIISALYRPGPKDCGMVESILEARATGRKPDWKYPEVEEVMDVTDGILTYQEQVLILAQKVAGYTLAEADLLRRAIGKKLPEEMIANEAKFKSGAIDRGFDSDFVDKLWNIIEGFSDYCLSYNTKILTVEYGFISIGMIVENRIDCNVYSINDAGLIYTQPIVQWHKRGIREVFRYELEDGAFIEATPDHKFMTTNGEMLSIETIFQENKDLRVIEL